MQEVRQPRRRDRDEPIEAVIERARPQLESLIVRFQIPAQDAEDLLQQTFLIFLQKREAIRNDEAWLVCVARRHCLQYLRRRKSRYYESLDSSLRQATSFPEQEHRSLLHDLNRAICRIPERCRSLLRMRYLGYRSKEIAEETGFQVANVRKVASRCLAALTHQMVGSQK